MTTYTIKPFATTSGTNGASIFAMLATINTRLQTDDVTLNCYRGGNVVGSSSVSEDGSVAIFSAVAGRRLIINFVDAPATPFQQHNVSSNGGTGPYGEAIDGRYLNTFAGTVLRLRVADITVNGWWSQAASLFIESNTTGDNDTNGDPMNNGGTATVTAVINNAASFGGDYSINVQDGGTVTATYNNCALVDGPMQLGLGAASTLNLNLNHVGLYGGDGGAAITFGGAGNTVNLVAKNSLFCGNRGLFATSTLTGQTINSAVTTCVPSTVGQTMAAAGYALEGDSFVINPHPGGGASDLRLKTTSPAIAAGTAGVLATDGAGRARATIGASLGPIEPHWTDVWLGTATAFSVGIGNFTVQQPGQSPTTITADGIKFDTAQIKAKLARRVVTITQLETVFR